MSLISKSEKFLEWIDAHRKATYKEINKFAEKNEVKVDSLLRITRQNTGIYTGGLVFIKYGFDGKPIKGKRPFLVLQARGKYHLPTVLKK